MNREMIPPREYRKLMSRFTAEKFNADALCALAAGNGMRYIVFTTMHHDGFRMYDSVRSKYNVMHTPAGRDLTAEIIKAAAKHNLKIGLYHSLNNWHDSPDGVKALEDKKAYAVFIKNTFERIRELVTKFNPIDILWYDGWWPYDAAGWKAEEMNAMVKSIQPKILFNGRNCLPGDFATPEGHLSAPRPWRPWEACIPTNNSWGYCKGDRDWKNPRQILDLLITAAQGRGNLLLNIGLCPDGSVPEKAKDIIQKTGAWLSKYGQCVYHSDLFQFDPYVRKDFNGDWAAQGQYTVFGKSLFLMVRRWPGKELTIGGIQCRVKKTVLLGAAGKTCSFTQKGQVVTVHGLPEQSPDPLCPVIRFDLSRVPTVYQTAGMRIPKVPHPHYDPVKSDINW